MGRVVEIWNKLKEYCKGVRLTDTEGRCVWFLTNYGTFSVRSLYVTLKKSQVKVPYRKVWYVKTPLEIKVFLWLAFRKSILTKSVLLRRGWKGNGDCMFCSNAETIDHLFFECPLARYAWSVVRCAFNLP